MWDSAVLSAFLLSPSAISHFNVFLVQKRKSEVGSKKPTNLLSWYQPEIILNPTNEIILMKLNREFSHFRNKNGSTKRCYVLQARTRAVTGPHCDTWSIARYNSTWHDWDKFELKTVKLSVDSKTKPVSHGLGQAMSALLIWSISYGPYHGQWSAKPYFELYFYDVWNAIYWACDIPFYVFSFLIDHWNYLRTCSKSS